MSASLVGSEMCIRDRLRPRQISACRGQGAIASFLFPTSGKDGFRWAAVSYTHLTLPTICSV
eukprot:8440077-Alexandrium_andersonii.AAC.1